VMTVRCLEEVTPVVLEILAPLVKVGVGVC